MKHVFAFRKKTFFPKLLTPILGSQSAATFRVTLAISLISYEGSKIATLFSGSFLGPDFGVKKCDILALIFRFFCLLDMSQESNGALLRPALLKSCFGQLSDPRTASGKRPFFNAQL